MYMYKNHDLYSQWIEVLKNCSEHSIVNTDRYKNCDKQ